MSYIENSLMPGEQIIIATEMHWIIFFWPMIFSLAAVWFIFLPKSMPVLNYFGVFLIVYLLGGVFVRYLCTTYVLTNKRAILKRGFMFVKIWDISLARVESVLSQQSLFGRLFGYGDLVVNGTGGDQLVFTGIENPSLFRQKIFEIMDAEKNRA